jgi:outer membrane protein OmpA-like peptidoglycan-associated protein
MKTLKIMLTLLLLCSYSGAEAQLLKKLGKRATQAAERALERKVEEKSERTTEKGFDSVFNNETRAEKRKRKRREKKERNTSNDNASNDPIDEGATDAPEMDMSVIRISDFTPGERTLFEDDFSQDAMGDFPVKWDTNGSGEILSLAGKNWFRLSGKSTFYPILEKKLPENYTITFDMHITGVDNKTSSNSMLRLLLSGTEGFNKNPNWCMVELSPCQFISSRGVVEKVTNNKRDFRNLIGKDYRETILGTSRISIAVNKTRMRVWLNDNKLVDVPRLIPSGANIFKLQTEGLRDMANTDEVYITNFRIGAAGEDNRSKLITEGRLSTNAILFESASAELKGSSYAIISEIAQVLKDNAEVHIKIIGHTDGDGPDASNLTLSRKRSESVKQALITAYGIDAGRIQTDGMGENQPIASNSTKEGKAQNRRVEFVKI